MKDLSENLALPRTVHAVGSNDGYPVDYEVQQGGVIKRRFDSFFIDEPDRDWSVPFGSASRWIERLTPTVTGNVLDGGYDDVVGHPPSNIVYQGGACWMTHQSNGALWSHTYQDELNLAWPFRIRDRVSLNNAVERQRRKLTSHDDGLAETIGELPECKSLFKLVSRYRGLKSNLSGLYLGYRFGWKPTVDAFLASCQELSAWLRAVDALRRRRDGTLTLVYRGSDDYSLAKVNRDKVIQYASSYRSPENRGCVATRYFEPVLDAHSGTITYMARIRSRCRFDRSWDIMSRLGRIGALPSLTTVWALMPSSFLYDWFVSIGDMISNIQGNLLYDQDLLCEAWSWSLKDTITLHYRGRDSFPVWRQEVEAFYRSRSFPLAFPGFPRLGLVSPVVLPTLAVLLASRLPGDTMSVRSLYRTLKRLGYAW